MTPLKDILNIAVPKIPLELQADARQDESYAFTGCIDMIVALNIDADVIWEETEEITDETIAGGMLKSSSSKKAVANNGQVKLTAQKLAELKAKYPTIDWEHDAVAMYGIDGIKNQPEVDTSAPGLRPRYKRNN